MRKIIALLLVLMMLGSAACQIVPKDTSGASSDPSQTSAPQPSETTPFEWNDSPPGTLACYKYTDGEDVQQIPLAGYKSGIDPVFLNTESLYEISGYERSLYLFADDLPSKITDEPLLNITHDLTLSSEMDGTLVSWRSSDESLIESSGKVHRPHDRSRYVLLEAHFAQGEGAMTSRYILRVARDMYADTDPESLPVLAHDGVYHEPPAGTEGEWFVFDTMNQITRFDPQADVMVNDYSTDSMRNYLISGKISMPRIDTENEAYLCISTLADILHISYSIKYFDFQTAESDIGDMRYDYIQSFNGVPVLNGMIRVMSSFRRPFTTVVVNVLMIPDDFDTNPNFTAAEIEEKFGLQASELVIKESNGVPVLMYHGYSRESMEELFVDAKTGKELERYSMIVD